MTKLDVINMALDMLGEEPIDSSTNRRTSMAKKAHRWYPRAARFVLEAYDWQSAIEMVTLTTEASITNVWNDYYEYVYSLPSDALRVLNLDFRDNADFLVEQGYIYTNQYDATNGIMCRYIQDIREESNSSLSYSDLLGETIATRLAFNMCRVAEKGVWKQMYDDALTEAEAQDRMEHANVDMRTGKWWTDES